MSPSPLRSRLFTLESGEFPTLSPEVLGLLGISGGSYVISKGIQSAKDKAEGAKS